MINVGIIGLGFMAATHLRAYQQISGVNIAALCNPSGRNLDGDFSKVSGNIDTGTPLKLDMGRIKTYREVRDLLEDSEVHLVDICTPTASHGSLATGALRAGKHVLCEKPLARSVQAAREIAAAAETARGFFMPAMCLRFWPEWAWLKGTIASQRYGRVLAARFRRVAEPPGWGHQTFMNGKESGGALFDLHIHDTDFVHYCFGRPHSVFSTGYSKVSGAVDHIVTQYKIAEGLTVHAEGGWAMTKGFGFQMSYTVNFEKATADYDLARGEDALKIYEEGKEPLVLKCEGPDGYVRELKHMVDSIASSRAPEVVTVRDAVVSVQICEAEEQSVQSGQPVLVGD